MVCQRESGTAGLDQERKSKWATYAVIWSFAEAAQRAGEPARAVRLYWGAKSAADSIGAWTEDDESEFEDKLEACRVALDKSDFAIAVDQGRSMPLEQAVAYALES